MESTDESAETTAAPVASRLPVGRRALIGAGAGLVGLAALTAAAGFAVENRILPGRSTLHEVLGLNGSAGRVPAVEPGPMVTGSFLSAARLGATCGWAVSYPPHSAAGEALPVLVVLHGYGSDHSGAFGTHLGLDRFLAQAVQPGVHPFAIAAVDGGNTYWHRRTSGEDAGAMVLDEFLPLLAGMNLDTSRVAFLGWSMGGYGALRLAGILGSSRVASVVAESPALWHTAAEAAHVAFDGPSDFAANTAFGHETSLAGIPLRIDCGTGDGFYPAVRDYVQGLHPQPAGGFTGGGHNLDFWRRVAPDQLLFVGRHFA